ncbi:MAG: hypothetical protein M3247_08935 [Thermoproteota archaeon]|nr:hypothetical protein [Thermoproteota archaeon]
MTFGKSRRLEQKLPIITYQKASPQHDQQHYRISLRSENEKGERKKMEE